MAIPTPTRPLNRLLSTRNGILVDSPGGVDCAGMLCAAPDVPPEGLQAVDDAFIMAAGGDSTGSVLDNDTLNGDPVDGLVVLTPGQSPSLSLTMDPDTGVITADGEILPGVYVYPYEICEIADPENCSSAEATITIEEAPVAMTSGVFLTLDSAPGGELCSLSIADAFTVTAEVFDPEVGATFELVATDSLTAEATVALGTNPDTFVLADFTPDLDTLTAPMEFTIRRTDAGHVGEGVDPAVGACDLANLTPPG